MGLNVRDAAAVSQVLATSLDLDGAHVPHRIISGVRQPSWREEFNSFDTATRWTEVQLGPGMTITVDGVAAGARYLKIAAGTEVGETILQSKDTFRLPLELMVAVSISQRIANQAVHVELVEVDANGDVVVDTAVEPGAELNGARNGFGISWSGTSASNAAYYTRSSGNPILASALTSFGSNHTNATGTTPNFLPAYFIEMTAMSDLVTWQGQAIDSTSAGTGFKRTQCVPDPQKLYAIRIRVKNTAVVTNTDVRVHFMRVLDANRIPVDFSFINSRADGQLAVPVNAAGGTVNATTIAYPTFYADTTANLGAGATFTGTSRDLGSSAAWQRFVAYAIAPSGQDGTLIVEHSTDNSTWWEQERKTVTGGAPVVINALTVARYYRVRYVNGGVAHSGSGFAVRSALHRI